MFFFRNLFFRNRQETLKIRKNRQIWKIKFHEILQVEIASDGSKMLNIQITHETCEVP